MPVWKSKQFILLLVLAAVIVAGSIGGIVYAQGGDDEEDVAPRTALLERVADKLGIDAQQLKDAFTEVIEEMRDEAQLKWLDKAVEEGLITEEEAQEYSEWWAARPDVDFGSGGLGQRGILGFGGFRMRDGCGFGVWHMPGAEQE
jgi:hypothetical protein